MSTIVDGGRMQQTDQTTRHEPGTMRAFAPTAVRYVKLGRAGGSSARAFAEGGNPVPLQWGRAPPMRERRLGCG